jgi:hypothetical protein
MNKLQIYPPEGYEIDQDKLSKGVVHFKKSKKVLSYKDVANEIFKFKSAYYLSADGTPNCVPEVGYAIHPVLSKTKTQLESILALNKLCNVAKYLNGDWLPSHKHEHQYYIQININSEISSVNSFCGGGHDISSNVYFKSKELAQQAIEILGEDEIRKALTLNH